jgi:hypothetical protein
VPSPSKAKASVKELQTQESPVLERVVERSTPEPGQIVIGTLIEAGGKALGLADVPALGRVRIVQSLIPLGPEQVGRQMAISLLGIDSALVLGVLWNGDAAPAADLSVDGERRVITANESIELRCGESAIVLQADGRIHLRGHYITSEASATQRILGGSVNVN